MEFKVRLQLRLSLSKPKMAIAFFVDPQYGPLPAPVAQQSAPPPPPPVRRPVPPPPGSQSAPSRHGGNNRPLVTVDENNNHVIPDLIHGVAYFPQMYSTGNQSQVSPSPVLMNSSQRESPWLSWLPINRLISYLFSNTTPLSPFGNSQRGEAESRRDELPDVVQCHRGFSFDLSIQSTRVYGSRHLSPALVTSDEETPRRRRHPAAVQYHHHQPTPLNQDVASYARDADDMDEWNIELKVAVNSCKEVGADLREIGDQYAFEFESSLQRQRSPRHESLKVQCIFRLATFPALAMVGVVTGLIYLRRHL